MISVVTLHIVLIDILQFQLHFHNLHILWHMVQWHLFVMIFSLEICSTYPRYMWYDIALFVFIDSVNEIFVPCIACPACWFHWNSRTCKLCCTEVVHWIGFVFPLYVFIFSFRYLIYISTKIFFKRKRAAQWQMFKHEHLTPPTCYLQFGILVWEIISRCVFNSLYMFALK